METLEEDGDEVRIVICPGKSSNVFENYVFIPINNTGFIGIKHVLRFKDIVNNKHPKELDLSSDIYFSTGKTFGIKGALTHLLNI